MFADAAQHDDSSFAAFFRVTARSRHVKLLANPAARLLGDESISRKSNGSRFITNGWNGETASGDGAEHGEREGLSTCYKGLARYRRSSLAAELTE